MGPSSKEPQSMPSVTQSPTFASSKKRRRDDNDGSSSSEAQVPLYGSILLQTCRSPADGAFYTSSPQNNHHNHSNPFSALGNNNERLIFSSSSPHSSSNHRDLANPPVYNLPRKVIPLPVSKRFRTLDDDTQHEKQDRQQQQQQQQLHFTHSHAHPEYSTPPISPQIQPYHPHHQHQQHQVRPNTAAAAIIKPSPAPLLDPCHICHRKPTKKSDLDSFADCMGCGQRTCFVCIRQCQGWWLGSESTGEEGGRPTHTAAVAASVEEQQHPHEFSSSFTMQDVDDDYMETHQMSPPVNHRPQKPHRGQNKGGGGGNSSNGRNGEDRRRGGGGGGPEEGWSGRGHRDVICSRCCVERGSEGDVVCLGCLAGMEEGT